MHPSKSGPLPGPLREHAGPGAGFEDAIVWPDHRHPRGEPCQRELGREMLVSNLLFAADGLGRQQACQRIQCHQARRALFRQGGFA